MTQEPKPSAPPVALHTTTDDLRIRSLRPLVPPAILMEDIAPNPAAYDVVAQARKAVVDVMQGRDKRLLLVIGPCSVHDPDAAYSYAERLKTLADRYTDELLIVMRTYFEKPRTIVGWKGLINDPNLDETFAINEGLRRARRLLVRLADLGMPAGTEFLDPITPQFVADLVSWGAIGARTTESQVHRELASGLSMPVGFKNGTGGTTQIAIDAIRSAAHAHHFLSVTKHGTAAIVATRGNEDCHLILRGGKSGPNYGVEAVAEAAKALGEAGVRPRMMVDCSHANSRKDFNKQPEIAGEIADRILAGEDYVFGLMMESFLVDGRQDYAPGQPPTFGQSITDACMGWERTEAVLEKLATAMAKRAGKR